MALQIIALNHWIVFSDICIVDIMTAQVFASSHTPAPGSPAGRGAALLGSGEKGHFRVG
jgi:hypothetical protein